MPIKKHDTDILSHRRNGLDSIVSAPQGCITLKDPVSICYKFNGNSIDVSLKIAGVEVASASINPENPCLQLGGSTFLATAEVDVCFDFDTLDLKIDWKVCIFSSCESGSVVFKL